MSEQSVKSEEVTINYLYVIRVELAQPIHKGSWKSSRIADVIYSPRNVSYQDGMLEYFRPGRGTRRVVNPIFWDIGAAIPLPGEEDTEGWYMCLEKEVSVNSDNPSIAFWTPTSDGGVLLATLYEDGRLIKPAYSS